MNAVIVFAFRKIRNLLQIRIMTAHSTSRYIRTNDEVCIKIKTARARTHFKSMIKIHKAFCAVMRNTEIYLTKIKIQTPKKTLMQLVEKTH